MSTILIVDDDPGVVAAFRQVLQDQGRTVVAASNGEDAFGLIARDAPDLVVMDIRLPGRSGLETFRRIKSLDPRLPVIIMTGHATTEAAIEATKLGAFDYHLKPLVPERILESIDNALTCVRLMRRKVGLDTAADPTAPDSIVGQSEAMQRVYMAIGRVAATDATVLIRGETGTGKELVARALYQHSQRARAPLVVVNCAASPENLLESELFGHERGAFTGADQKRVGKFEQAAGGTIFLDEVGELPPNAQAKFLRVLQEKTFERLGGREPIAADVRILAATNRDLETAGRFREDLYHRLRVFTIQLPPLRERRSDIPELADYFLRRLAAELNAERPVLASDALDLLVAHGWPGNVRELQHCLQRALINTGGYPIRRDDIARALHADKIGGPSQLAPGDERQWRAAVEAYLHRHAGEGTHAGLLETVERLLLERALRLDNGNQSRAALRLGLARPTLKAKLDKYGLEARAIERKTDLAMEPSIPAQ